MESVDFLYLKQGDVENIINNKSSSDVIIFLSGKSSHDTPLNILRNNDTIAVNGSATYLINNDIVPFIYLVTDKKFYQAKPDEFWNSIDKSKYSIISFDLYNKAKSEDKEVLRRKCLILKDVYTNQFGGPLEIVKYFLSPKNHRI